MAQSGSSGSSVGYPGGRQREIKGKGVNLLVLVVVWLLLVGKISVVTVIGGILIALLVSVIFPLPLIYWRGWVHPIGLIRLVGYVLWDLARASVQLAVFAFDLKRQPKPGIIAEQLSSDGDLYQVGTGAIMSIVPGSMVVDARRRTRTLYMHIFDMSHSTPDEQRGIGQHEELRILRAFGTNEEIRHAKAVMRGEAQPMAVLQEGERR